MLLLISFIQSRVLHGENLVKQNGNMKSANLALLAVINKEEGEESLFLWVI